MIRELLLSVFLFFVTGLSAYAAVDQKTEEQCRQIYLRWIEEYIDLTQNCVGYSPPVAARSFYFVSLANYEAISELKKEMRSMSGQIDKFNRTVKLNKDKVSFPHIINCLNLELCNHFYKPMSPSSRKKMEDLFTAQLDSYKRSYSKKILEHSEAYASRLAAEIIEFSINDGGHEAYRKNFPESYKPPVCDGCWEKTFPGYTAALLPYWGQNRLSLSSNLERAEQIPVLTYSEDTSSLFHKENEKLNELYQHLTAEQEVIAEYWDDGPGITGTPAGHQFSIALQLCRRNELTLERTGQLFLMLGMAINDAMILTWKLKYRYNLVRPITYIQEFINPEFNTLITTPPFPEYPSGHSFQAGASGAVLTHFFGPTISFTDSTHYERTDINGSPRTYETVEQMMNEMSLSRFYGGIHYFYTLQVSLDYGFRIGTNCLSQIKFR